MQGPDSPRPWASGRRAPGSRMGGQAAPPSGGGSARPWRSGWVPLQPEEPLAPQKTTGKCRSRRQSPGSFRAERPKVGNDRHVQQEGVKVTLQRNADARRGENEQPAGARPQSPRQRGARRVPTRQQNQFDMQLRNMCKVKKKSKEKETCNTTQNNKIPQIRL